MKQTKNLSYWEMKWVFQNGYSWRCTFATMKDNKVWFDFNLILVLGNEVFLYLIIYFPLVRQHTELGYPYYLHDGTLISWSWCSLPLKFIFLNISNEIFILFSTVKLNLKLCALQIAWFWWRASCFSAPISSSIRLEFTGLCSCFDPNLSSYYNILCRPSNLLLGLDPDFLPSGHGLGSLP